MSNIFKNIDIRGGAASATLNTGIYTFYGTNSSGGWPTNVSSNNGIGILVVFHSSNYIVQICFDIKNNKVYYRSTSENGGNWINWIEK